MQETYTIYGKEYPVVGHANVVDKGKVTGTVPIVDIPQMSDYKWQLDCLNDRLEHPEKYEPFENIEEHIAKLRQWLAEHKPDEPDSETGAGLAEWQV